MTTRRPPPFKPLASVARNALPGQRDRYVPQLPQDVVGEVVARVVANREAAVPFVTITADVTIPQVEGYAKRLNNLLQSLRSSLLEEAPWLDNIEITVSVRK